MALTKVEEFLFRANRAHLVTGFRFEQGAITVTLTPVDKFNEVDCDEVTATFKNASVPDIWKDPADADEWPRSARR